VTTANEDGLPRLEDEGSDRGEGSEIDSHDEIPRRRLMFVSDRRPHSSIN
jgi:hypothetical protein